MSNQQPIKFKMNAKQKEIFEQLTTAQQIRLLQALEARQSKTIKASDTTRRARVQQDDSQDIVNQYQDRLI